MSDSVDLPVTDGQYSTRLYESIPCTIGYVYLRIEVDGTVRPCCISRVHTGSVLESDLGKIWHGARQQAFRRKMLRINHEHFHKTDPDWAFCKQCSHKMTNHENFKIMQEFDPETRNSKSDKTD